MVAIDAGYLGLMLHPAAKPPNDPSTGEPTVRAKERVENLFEILDAAHERIIIPAPALGEFLVLAANDGPAYLNEITTLGTFDIKPFDIMAASELAAMELLARNKGSKRHPLNPETPWQKVKFDRQIVAIAKIHNCHTIYSDDRDVKNIAEDVGIKVVSCWELDFPIGKMPLLDQLDETSQRGGRKFRDD
jgi:predicted nucleic acid-binding protein